MNNLRKSQVKLLIRSGFFFFLNMQVQCLFSKFVTDQYFDLFRFKQVLSLPLATYLILDKVFNIPYSLVF